MSVTLAAPNRHHFAGIFIVALVAIAYQVLLTRIFSVVLYYHFAFAGISLAMLGMTNGAERVFLHEKRFAVERLEREWARAALGFSVSSVALVLAFIYGPSLLPAISASVIELLLLVLFVIPFTYSGICVTLILTKSSASISRLYAADLVGAALGCILIVATLLLLDPISLIFLMASLTAFSAWLMARKLHHGLASWARMLGYGWLAASLVQGGLYLSGHDHLKISWAKGEMLQYAIFERWNSYSQVRVVPVSLADRTELAQGWGFGHPQTQTIRQLKLTIDANAATVISNFDGDLKPLGFLSNDIINMPYHIRPMGSVAVIGVGGGRDILSALYFGAQQVTGIELNPAILEGLTKRFATFAGHLEQRPGVSLINAEARSWLNQAQQAFDLIQISLIDTWAATAAGGLTLSENKLYTVDAWKDFMARLTPHGVLSVSRWFEPSSHRGEFYRLLSIAAETLRQRGVPADEIRRHMLAFNVGKIITVVVSADALTKEDVSRARQAADSEGFRVMIDPDSSWDKVSEVIVSGAADGAFYAALPIDVTPSTDDRPFFFNVMRLKDVLQGNGARETSEDDAVYIIAFLLMATSVFILFFVYRPLAALSRQIPMKAAMPYLGYFAGIGIGFMLIEISQMQRLMIFLGHPVYGLTVILFTLLLFGGLGSMSVHPLEECRDTPIWVRPAVLCILLAATGLLTPIITEQLKDFGTAARILSSIALLAPTGLFMGMMFPVGMAISKRYQGLRPWFWGINGATSVFASVFGVVISMEYSISLTYWIGVACYLACLAIVGYDARIRPTSFEVAREHSPASNA